MSLLGEALRFRREELGLDQGQVARRLQVSQQTVSRWEKGLAVPRPGRVLALAELLRTDAGRLQGMAGYRAPDQPSEPSLEALYGGMRELSRAELMELLDRAWTELRAREGTTPPGTV